MSAYRSFPKFVIFMVVWASLLHPEYVLPSKGEVNQSYGTTPVDKAVNDDEPWPVELTCTPNFSAVGKVFVAGTFNGWSDSKTPMSDPNNDGTFSVILWLTPGTYLYKFVIDGEWIRDLDNPETAEDGFGDLCSVITVDSPFSGKVSDKEEEIISSENLKSIYKVAIVVGVDKYPAGSGLRPLDYAVRDAEEVGIILENLGFIVIIRKDSGATRGVILNSMENIRQSTPETNSLFLFYFSGHGFQDGEENYLATYESATSQLATTGLGLRELQNAIKRTGAKQQILWIDACRSDPDGKGTGTRSFSNLALSEGLRALFSTSEGGTSYESPILEHGVFTYFLLQGLKGHAAGSDGLVTFRDLSDFVLDGVRRWGLQNDCVQVPFEAGEAAGDFLIGRPIR